MIQFPAQAEICVMHAPVNFRNGIDGLCGIVRQILAQDPMTGAFFAFKNRNGHSIKILFYDGSGYWVLLKRLSGGCFRFWPKADGTRTCSNLLARELQILLWGGDPASCRFPELWRKVS